MEPGVTAAALPTTQAVAYHAGSPDAGAVALVLGGGNVSSIGPMDALYKLFVEDQVVLYKTHPVNVYLGPLLEEGLQALIHRGFLKVVYGGAEEGAYLCQHPGVDEIHITGSDRTYEAIVFGPGAEGRRRKERNEPLLTKRVTAELGNVSPVIVVPGPAGSWSASDLRYQAENLVTMLVEQRRLQLQRRAGHRPARRLAAARGPPRRHAPAPARDPAAQGLVSRSGGALERLRRRPSGGGDVSAERATDGRSPPLDAHPQPRPAEPRRHLLHHRGLLRRLRRDPHRRAELPEYLERAVAFANETLWGTLNATLIVHPASLRDRAVRQSRREGDRGSALRHRRREPLGGPRATAS